MYADVTSADHTESTIVSMLGLGDEFSVFQRKVLKDFVFAFFFGEEWGWVGGGVLLSVVTDVNILTLLPQAKQHSTHAPRKQLFKKSSVENQTVHYFSFLFFFLAVNFSKSRK